MGCYLHGLFAADGFRHAFLNRIKTRAASGLAFESEIDRVLDTLAEHLETHLDLDALLEAARAAPSPSR
jgi:adenosylcobyric acid synthase